MSTPTTAVATLAPYHSHRYHAPPYTHHHQGHPMATTAGFRTASGTTILPPSVTGSTTTTTTTAAVSTSQSHRLPPFYQTTADNAGYQYTPEAVVPLHHRPPSTSRPHAHQYSHLDAVLEAAAPPPSSPRFEDGYAAAPIGNTATTNMTTTSTALAQAGVVPDDQPSRKRRRSREPDWGTFYRNGLPKEVIIIHDTPEPEANTGRKVVTSTTTTTTTTTAAADTHGRQAAKKRRRDEASGHHYHVQYAASTHTNSSLQESTPGSSTISSDRTSALHTTAPTSLGSSSQYGEALAPLKRKRNTRQQAANEAKRREADVLTGPFATYRPPPFPPKKAGEVHVRAIQDHPYNKGIKVDDEDGHYIVVPDADLTESYRIVRLLGQGTFGKVVQAHDRKQNKAVAIKIIRSVQKYRDASRIELRVLATIKANDEDDRNRCIHLRDCFDFRGHICIVMDLLGQSVFDFLKGNGFVPFPNSHIQSFARQLFSSVAFLHDLNLIHTDLKPENILLYDNAYQTFTYNRKIPSSSTTINRQATQRRVLLDTEIRLIDFGSATFQDEYHSSVVSTRHYRAPEIILGLGWSFPCDIWSIGCILVEFFTGDALFQTHDNLEHLAMMEAVVGSRIDTHLVQGVNKMTTRGGGNPASKYFKRLRLDYPTPETTRGSRRFVKAMKHLEDIIPSNNTFFRNFLDLLRKIFVYDPAHRITAKQALEHAWFKEMAQPDDGTEAAKIRLERKRMELEKRHAHYVG